MISNNIKFIILPVKMKIKEKAGPASCRSGWGWVRVKIVSAQWNAYKKPTKADKAGRYGGAAKAQTIKAKAL
jgi:hypothetical protein